MIILTPLLGKEWGGAFVKHRCPVSGLNRFGFVYKLVDTDGVVCKLVEVDGVVCRLVEVNGVVCKL